MHNILIIGAGEAGRIIASELKAHDKTTVIGFLDDNEKLFKKKYSGVKVLGSIKILSKIVKIHVISEIIVAIPSIKGKVLKPIIREIQKVNIPYRITPGYFNCQTNDVDIHYPIRTIDIADLLGRHKVDIELQMVSKFIKGKKVLITGAGGSIGSEICFLIASFLPKEIVLLGRGEGSIFDIHSSLKLRFAEIKATPVIASCTDKKDMEKIFLEKKPEIVFHAAAHKHVPFMEMQPREAFKNNVMGSVNVFEASKKSKVKSVVVLSTDKAVQPKSVMGISKRLVECLIQNDFKLNDPLFSGVRFGNVLGSKGSVVELFNKQIEAGGPVTITDKKAKRYFMTIPEAAQLVLMAAVISQPGHIYALDLGEQTFILKLAKELIQLHGYIPYKDISIKEIGMRPGEKLKEALLISKKLQKTIHKKIWDDKPPCDKEKIKDKVINLYKNLDCFSEKEVLLEMKKLIKKCSK